MKQSVHLTLFEARRFLLLKHGLLGEWRFAGKAGAYAFVRQAGCIQFDPVDACGRNAELTLFSRVKGCKRSDLFDLLYRDRTLFDYADKELSVIPTEDWPCFSHIRRRCIEQGKQFEGLQEAEAFALDYIRAHGPVRSDTLPLDGELFWHSSMHWSGNRHGKSAAARSVLEQLYSSGVLVVCRKEGTRKVYDLAERCIPKALLDASDPFSDEKERIAWQVLRRIGATGLLPARRSDAYLGVWNLDAKGRDAAFSRLLAEGRILPVSIEGLSEELYCRAEDRPLLARAMGSERFAPRCAFLAPLDPLLWDRRLIGKLFGFSYTWEIYTPPQKRRFGAYVLPILYGERFVGRIEPVADRANGVLTVKNVWLEDDVKPTARLRAAIGTEARRLMRFNGCKTLAFSDTNGFVTVEKC